MCSSFDIRAFLGLKKTQPNNKKEKKGEEEGPSIASGVEIWRFTCDTWDRVGKLLRSELRRVMISRPWQGDPMNLAPGVHVELLPHKSGGSISGWGGGKDITYNIIVSIELIYLQSWSLRNKKTQTHLHLVTGRRLEDWALPYLVAEHRQRPSIHESFSCTWTN